MAILFERHESKNEIKFTDTSSISYEQWKKLLRCINYLGYGIPDEDFLKSYFDRGNWLNEDQSEVALKVLFGESVSEKCDKEIVAKYNALAIEHYGTTYSWNKAGYLLTTGELLDFSEGQYTREQDHRNIRCILDDDVMVGDGYSDALITFVNFGNARLQSNGMEISRPLTIQQKRRVAAHLYGCGEFYVDIANTKGTVIKSFVYEVARPSRVFADIEEYFESISL